jgi:hypothetical protein
MNAAGARQRILAWLPDVTHPYIRRAFRWTRDVAGAVRSARRLVGAERVVWPEFEEVGHMSGG